MASYVPNGMSTGEDSLAEYFNTGKNLSYMQPYYTFSVFNDLTEAGRAFPLGLTKEDSFLTTFRFQAFVGAGERKRKTERAMCWPWWTWRSENYFRCHSLSSPLLRQRLFVSSPCPPNWLALDLQGILLLMAPISSKNTGITAELKSIRF